MKSDRTPEQEKALYPKIAGNLQAACGHRRYDFPIILAEHELGDWSISFCQLGCWS